MLMMKLNDIDFELRNKGPFKYTVCAMCGRDYIKRPGSIYKVIYKGRVNQCCSYSCYQKAKKLKEELHNEETHKKFSDELKQ